MAHHFFAYMARMRLIKRWGLRRGTREENDQEHSLQVAMVAHAMAETARIRYGAPYDMSRVLRLAIYHEAAEVITGDLASPIKYFNPGIKDAFKGIERLASEQLLGYLPDDLKPAFRPLLFPDETSREWRLVKAADKICAYLKCVEELGQGNTEFQSAERDLLKEIGSFPQPEVGDFMREFAPSFRLSLDGLH